MFPPAYVRTEPGPRLHVLVLNSGSSSLKFGFYRVASSRTELLFCGEAEAEGRKLAGSYGGRNASARLKTVRGCPWKSWKLLRSPRRFPADAVTRLLSTSAPRTDTNYAKNIAGGHPSPRYYTDE